MPSLVRSWAPLSNISSKSTWELTVVLDYYEAMETYGRIGLLRSCGNLQSYWTTAKLYIHTVVWGCYEAMETYSRIEHINTYHIFPVVQVNSGGASRYPFT